MENEFTVTGLASVFKTLIANNPNVLSAAKSAGIPKILTFFSPKDADRMKTADGDIFILRSRNDVEKIKRTQIAHFLDISGSGDYAAAKWARLGVNTAEASTEYNPKSESTRDIISSSYQTDILSYQGRMPVTQRCTKGDPVFEYISGFRKNRSTLAGAHTWLLNADLWDTGDGFVFIGEAQKVSVQIDTYGGPGEEVPVQDFTLNFIENPVKGIVTMYGSDPKFFASA